MNIHGIHDLNQPESANNFGNTQSRIPQQNTVQNQWAYSLENLKVVEYHKILFLSGNARIKNPRNQNYFDILKFTWCPVFKFLSITFFILIAQLTLFIITVVIDLKKQGQFLEVQAQTLLLFGANFSPDVKLGQVYRLVVPQFLHVNLMHLIGNFFTTFIFVSRVEYTFGPLRTLAIYLLSGIGGNIFSDLVNPSNIIVKAGASTSLFGIIGTILGYLILNWRGLDLIGKFLKCQLIFLSLIIILFILILTPFNQNIDTYGHIGGFIIGMTICAIQPTIANENYQKRMRVIFIILCAAVLICWFLLFYLWKK